MTTVYKFPLQITDEQVVKMPKGAKILDAQMQAGVLCIWCVVDPDIELKEYKVWIIGTGHPAVKHPCFYVSTFQLPSRGLVFHVFIDINPYNI